MRELSSRSTFFYKFILPSLWIGMFSLVTLLMFLDPASANEGSDVHEMRWFFAGATLVGGTVIYWACVRLKKVTLVRDILIVSNFRREIEVPLRNIVAVSGSILMNPEVIWLEFRRPTAFGSRIVFAPRMRFFRGFSRHPLVAELRALIGDAGNRG